jgi:hypothetical protein
MNCCTTPDQVPPISKANRFTNLQYQAALLCGQTEMLAQGTEILAQINAAGSGQVLAPDGTALTVKHAFANVAASSTDANLVTAVTGKKIRVLGYAIHGGDTAGSDVTFNRKPVGAGVAISSLKNLAANQQMVAAQSNNGWFETNAGQGLTVTTGAGSTTGIDIVYVEV